MKARKNAQTPSTKTCKHTSMPGKRASQHAHAESTQTREYAKHAIWQISFKPRNSDCK